MDAKKAGKDVSQIEAFATALRTAFADARIEPENYKNFGANVAEQQSPPRHIPYGDYTVEGWLMGLLMEGLPLRKAWR